jgi:nicotinamide riboside kinase
VKKQGFLMKKKIKRIAVFGTHGSAKTTLVYKLATYYKMNDKNVTVIHETARQSPFPINENTTYHTTLFVIASQLQKELQAEAQGFEIAISDRALSDAFIYLDYLKRGNIFTKSLENFCFEWLRQYDVLIYLEPTKGFSITADGVRAADTNYQRAIINDFRSQIDLMQKKYDNKLNIIKAESNQIFDEDQCKTLITKINRSINEQVRDFNVV